MKKNIYENKNEDVLVKEAVNDDIKMLEDIIAKVNDIIFNLSLRMLGTIADAVDAAHKIRDYIYNHTEEFNKILQLWGKN